MRRTSTQIIYHLPGLSLSRSVARFFLFFGLLAFIQLSQATIAIVTLYYLFSFSFW